MGFHVLRRRHRHCHRGNVAEHWVANYFAARDRMDISVNISIGRALRLPSLLHPCSFCCPFVVAPFPMPLVFNGLEVAAVLLAALVANQVTQEAC